MRDRASGSFLWAAAMLACNFSSVCLAQPSAELRSAEEEPAAQISIELNKLEQAADACHAYFVVKNKTTHRLEELQLDVFVFDLQEIVLRRLALTFQDIRSERTKVFVFDLTDLPCANIGRFLVNETIACTDSTGGAVVGCSELLSAGTRAEAELEL